MIRNLNKINLNKSLTGLFKLKKKRKKKDYDYLHMSYHHGYTYSTVQFLRLLAKKGKELAGDIERFMVVVPRMVDLHP